MHKKIIVPGVFALVAILQSAMANEVKTLVPPSAMHAVEGILVGADGLIYGTSIHAQSVYRINPQTGRVDIVVGSPQGESDDIAIGPPNSPAAGILAWTAQRSGEIRILRPGGKPEIVLRDVPRVNPIAFSAEGRLFTAQTGAGEDTLWELDVVGAKPPRVVAKNQGQLNGFGFGPDGRLYAPLFRTDKLVAIDVDTGTFTQIAKDLGAPASVRVAANGDIYSVDYLKGDVWRTDAKTLESKIIASYPAPLDSLAIHPDGTLFLASVADSSVFAFNPKTNARHSVVIGKFTVATGMSMTKLKGREAVLVADPFGYRYVDTVTGGVTRPGWAANRGASTAVAANERYIAFTYAGSKNVKKIDLQTDEVVAATNNIKAPRGVALTTTGDVIVADAGDNKIVKLTSDSVVDLARNLHEPVGLLLESDTVALVTEFEAGAIRRVNLVTGESAEVIGGLANPTGLARMRDGRIAVLEPTLGRVLAVDAKTGARTVLAEGLALSLDGLDLPSNTTGGIAVGGNGTIYVSCPGDNGIVKIKPNAK